MKIQGVSEKRKRILALDLLRGAFMIAIIVDHLNWGPSIFHLFTGGGKMFVSPAEGFFVISGILIGYIYGPRMIKSFKNTAVKLWKRAFLLYALSVVFTLIYTAIAVHTANANGLPPVWAGGEKSFLLNTFLARYSYGWTDFLPRYAVFMAVAPFLLWLIVRGKAWIVAAFSITIWVLFHTTAVTLPFSAWGVIFFLSMIIGFYLPQIEAWAKNLPTMARRVSTTGLIAVASVTFAASSIFQILLPMLRIELPQASAVAITALAPHFDKATLGIGRLLLGIVWFWALYIIVRRYEKVIHRGTLGVLEIFGAKSLYTYGIHGFVVFMFTILSPAPANVTALESTVVAIMILTLMYVLIVSPVVARYLSYQYYSYRLHALLRYNKTYEVA